MNISFTKGFKYKNKITLKFMKKTAKSVFKIIMFYEVMKITKRR